MVKENTKFSLQISVGYREQRDEIYFSKRHSNTVKKVQQMNFENEANGEA